MFIFQYMTNCFTICPSEILIIRSTIPLIYLKVYVIFYSIRNSNYELLKILKKKIIIVQILKLEKFE